MEQKNKETKRGFRVIDRRVTALEKSGEQIEETAGVSDRPGYVIQLEQRVEALEAQLRDVGASVHESQEDVELAKTRIRRELGREFERRRRELLGEFLEVVDNLDRALGAGEREPAPAALTEGVALVRDLLIDKLRGFGIERIEALGARFDPALHEAFSLVPVDAEERDGTVVGIIRNGYRLGDELMRPAAVAVARYGISV